MASTEPRHEASDFGGCLVRIGTSTAGGVGLGMVVGRLCGPSSIGMGAVLGGVIGCFSSVVDIVRMARAGQ
jgi:hypothetical protein